MPRSVSDVMWPESLSVLIRAAQAPRLAEIGWEPPVDVLETDAGLLVVVALPGVSRDDVHVVVSEDEVLVRGTRRWPIRQAPALVHRLELPHGRFERRLPLPPGTYRLTETTIPMAACF